MDTTGFVILQLTISIIVLVAQNFDSLIFIRTENEQNEKQAKKMKGRIISLSSFILIVVTAIMGVKAEEKKQLQEKNARELRKADSLRFADAQEAHKLEIEESEAKVIRVFSETAIKYGLEYKRLHDSSGRVILRQLLDDSARRGPMEQLPPVIAISPQHFVLKKSDSAVSFTASFTATQNAALIEKFELYPVFFFYSGQFTHSPVPEIFLAKGEIIPRDTRVSRGLGFYDKVHPISQVNWMIIYCRIIYYDLNKKGPYEIEEYYGAKLGTDSVFNSLKPSFASTVRSYLVANKVIR